MSSEAEIVRSIMRNLNSIDGVFCFRTHGNSFSVRGIPDIIGCAKGRFFAIEAKKSAKNHPSKAQEYILHKLLLSGAKTYVIWDKYPAEVIEWISNLNQ